MLNHIGVTQLASPVGGYLHWCVSFGSQEGVSSRGGRPGRGKAAWFLFYYILGEWARARANTFLGKKALDPAGSRSDWHGSVFRLEGSSLHAHLVGT